MKHMLVGLCMSKRRAACQDIVSVCRASSIYPHVFVLSCIVGSNIIADITSTQLLLYANFFVLSIAHNKHCAVETASIHRLSAVQYMPYMDESSYLLQIVNAGFERMSECELKAIAHAHCIDIPLSSMRSALRKMIANHLFLGHCSFSVGNAVSMIPVGCLDFLAEFYFPHAVG